MGTMRTKIRDIRIRKRKKIHDISVTLGLRKSQPFRQARRSPPSAKEEGVLQDVSIHASSKSPSGSLFRSRLSQ